MLLNLVVLSFSLTYRLKHLRMSTGESHPFARFPSRIVNLDSPQRNVRPEVALVIRGRLLAFTAICRADAEEPNPRETLSRFYISDWSTGAELTVRTIARGRLCVRYSTDTRRSPPENLRKGRSAVRFPR